MALKGQAKKDYQREYMRKRRAVGPDPVRPVVLDPVIVEVGMSNVLEPKRTRLITLDFKPYSKDKQTRIV